MQATHRSGPLKQKNKQHHTLGHKSNRQIKQKSGGKISKFQNLVKKNKVLEWRHERKNRENDLKKQKKLNAINLKRRIGQLHNAPFIVTLLCFDDDPNQFSESILNLLTTYDEEDAIIQHTSFGHLILTCSRLKLRLQFLKPNLNNRYECLDAAKMTDVLLCVYNAKDENKINELKQDANSVLNAIYHQCLPTCLHVLFGLDSMPIKKQSNLRKSFQTQLNSWFPEEKLHFLDSKQDGLQLLNLIGNCKKKQIAYRERRSQLLADKLDFLNVDEFGLGVLRAYGFVRNKNLDVNKLIHVPGLGDFEIGKIEVLNDPYKTNKSTNINNYEKDIEMSSSRIYIRDPIYHQNLRNEPEVNYDDFQDEQELPTAEDIAKAEEEHLKRKKLVPKGMSEYQAAWLFDSDEDLDDDDKESSSQESSDLDMENEDQNYEKDDYESDDVDDNESIRDDEDMQSVITEQENDDLKYDERIDLNEEMETLERIKEEMKMNEMYPDEIDTPLNVPAKLRFAKYRGLASFHKTKWDPYENLPRDYCRTYSFQHPKRSRKLAFEGAELADGPSFGEYVMVEILNFRKEVYDSYVNENKLFLFYQLLKHEQRMSVMNVVIKKHHSFTLPIKSKERLIFHIGCRRYSVCPIFSIHSNGNKHKYEKFLRSDTQMVATFYAPITFHPCSVTVYKQFENDEQFLVATGSVLNTSPERIVVKRLILSGHPFKIHKTFCVIRYMFFNRDDILWFKPIELRTKYGRKGTIKEPLGTHGHMKCTFDRSIKSNDTVLMNLYKRVFPKWTYEPDLSRLNSI